MNSTGTQKLDQGRSTFFWRRCLRLLRHDTLGFGLALFRFFFFLFSSSFDCSFSVCAMVQSGPDLPEDSGSAGPCLDLKFTSDTFQVRKWHLKPEKSRHGLYSHLTLSVACRITWSLWRGSFGADTAFSSINICHLPSAIYRTHTRKPRFSRLSSRGIDIGEVCGPEALLGWRHSI